MNPLRWRKMTWAIWLFTGLMAAWIGFAVVAGATDDDCVEQTDLSRSTCDTASDVGTGIGVTALFCVWFLGFVVLGIGWLITRPVRRACPVCGHEARRGQTVCRQCGFDFARSTAPAGSA